MKITLTNFRNIRAAMMEFNGGAVVFGNNAQGKSSIIYALQYALYGRCAMTDGRGAGSERLIRDGVKSSEIEVVLNDVTVHCTINKKGSNEWYCTDADGVIMEDIKTRADLWKRWNLDIDRASIAGMPEAYLDSKELGDVLAGYLAGKIDVNNLLALCGPHQNWVRTFSAKKHVDLTDPTDLPRLGKLVEETRRDLNRDVKTARVAMDALGDTQTDRDPAELPKIEASLTTLRTRLEALNQELGRAQAARPRDVIDAEIVSALAALDAAKKQAESARSTEAEHQAAVDVAQAALNAAQQADATAKYEHSALTRRVNELKTALAAVQETQAGCCPTCNRELTEAVRAVMAEGLQKDLTTAEGALADAGAKCDAALESVKAAHLSTKAARQQLSEASALSTDAAANVRTLSAQVDALKREATITTRPAGTVQSDIDKTRAQIGRGETLVEQLTRAKQAAEHNAFLKHADAELEHLNWAVEYFRDGAALKELTGSRMAEFCDRVNSHLKPYELAVRIEQDGKHVSILINHRPAKDLNTGARALAAYGLARAFSDGAPVFLDDINHLDAGNRKALLLALRDAGSEVLVAGTWQQSKPLDGAAAMQLSPLSVYWVEDGIAAKLATQTIKEAANA